MHVIKHLRNGNGSRPVSFVRHQGRCGYAWGFCSKKLQDIPTDDLVTDERGVTWHPDFYTAMVAWAKHRAQLLGGGASEACKRSPVRRPVRKQRNLRSA